jgi:hypothetical protein
MKRTEEFSQRGATEKLRPRVLIVDDHLDVLSSAATRLRRSTSERARLTGADS